MKTKTETSRSSLRNPDHAGNSQVGPVSRRSFIGGLAVATAIALSPRLRRVPGAVADGLVVTDSEVDHRLALNERRLGVRYEHEDKKVLADSIRHNQAKLVQNVSTDSGMRIRVMQAQTGQNPDLEMRVDGGALNQTVNFLIAAMSPVNAKNGNPVDPRRIAALQAKAAKHELDNVQLTVIMSGTGGFHTPDGVLAGGGASFNMHPFSESDPRKTAYPLICFAPDIYHPGAEVATPEPVVGVFPDEKLSAFPELNPTTAQSLTAHFAHEASHVLLDLLGSEALEQQFWDGVHIGQDYSHKKFVSPLNWYHTAAMAGQIAGEPAIPPSFIVPKLA